VTDEAPYPVGLELAEEREWNVGSSYEAALDELPYVYEPPLPSKALGDLGEDEKPVSTGAWIVAGMVALAAVGLFVATLHSGPRAPRITRYAARRVTEHQRELAGRYGAQGYRRVRSSP